MSFSLKRIWSGFCRACAAIFHAAVACSRVIAGVLATLLLIVSALGHFKEFIDPERVPWMMQIAQWSPLALVGLLLILYLATEHELKQARRATDSAVNACQRLDGAQERTASQLEEAHKVDSNLSLTIQTIKQHVARQVELIELKIKTGVQDLETLRQQIENLRDTLVDQPTRAKVHFLEGRYDEAANLYRDLLQAPGNAENPEYSYRLWKCLTHLGSPDEAKTHEARAKEWIEQHKISELESLAKIKLKQGEYQEAEHLYGKAITDRRRDAMTLYSMALAQLRTDGNRAKVTLAEVIEYLPRFQNPVTRLALEYLHGGDFDKAIDLCSDKLAVNTNWYSVTVVRAEAYVHRANPGDWESAEADLQYAEQHNPGDFNIYRVASELHIRQARVESEPAVRKFHLERAIAKCNAGIERLRSASTDADLSVREGLQAMLFHRKAEAQLLNQHYAEALESAQAAVQLGVRYFQNHLVFVEALIAQRMWIQAMTSAKAARSIGGAPGAIFSLIYETLCGLCAGVPLVTLEEPLQRLVSHLETFALRSNRLAWSAVQANVLEATQSRPEEQKGLVAALVDLLDGSRPQETVMAELQRFAAKSE